MRLSTLAVSTLVPALKVLSTFLPDSTLRSLVRHEGRALAGLHVLELDDGPELTLDLEDHAVLEVVGGCHVGDVRLRRVVKESVGGPRARRRPTSLVVARESHEMRGLRLGGAARVASPAPVARQEHRQPERRPQGSVRPVRARSGPRRPPGVASYTPGRRLPRCSTVRELVRRVAEASVLEVDEPHLPSWRRTLAGLRSAIPRAVSRGSGSGGAATYVRARPRRPPPAPGHGTARGRGRRRATRRAPPPARPRRTSAARSPRPSPPRPVRRTAGAAPLPAQRSPRSSTVAVPLASPGPATSRPPVARRPHGAGAAARGPARARRGASGTPTPARPAPRGRRRTACGPPPRRWSGRGWRSAPAPT